MSDWSFAFTVFGTSVSSHESRLSERYILRRPTMCKTTNGASKHCIEVSAERRQNSDIYVSASKANPWPTRLVLSWAPRGK